VASLRHKFKQFCSSCTVLHDLKEKFLVNIFFCILWLILETYYKRKYICSLHVSSPIHNLEDEILLHIYLYIMWQVQKFWNKLMKTFVLYCFPLFSYDVTFSLTFRLSVSNVLKLYTFRSMKVLQSLRSIFFKTSVSV
jgi:hypothetical protein